MPFIADHRVPLIQKIGSAEHIGAGKTAIFKIPTQATYQDLVIEAKIAGAAATRAQLESMLLTARLTISGKEKFTIAMIELIAIEEFYNSGSIGDTGYIHIGFIRQHMLELANQEDAAYGTLGEKSIELAIEQDPTSTIDTFDLHARTYPIAEPLGAHIFYQKITPTFGATGTMIFDDLPMDPNTFLYALHFRTDPAKLISVRLTCDTIKLIDTKFSLLNQFYKYNPVRRTPQTAKGFAHLDLCNRNVDKDALPMTMRTCRLELDFITTAPGAFPIICEFGGRTQPPTGITR